jgi:hypothetical protein
MESIIAKTPTVNVGQRFKKLQVIGRPFYVGAFGKNKYQRKQHVVCKCDCGTVLVVETCNLRRPGSKSCGCERAEIASNSFKKHGLSNTRLYHTWKAMIWRCRKPEGRQYKNYGGRGVHVCDEWSRSFELFYNWSMANGYQDSFEIDRINNHGNYEPSNCRFVSKSVNSRNKRTNRLITIGGVTKCTVEWAEEVGIAYSTIATRLHTGWEDEKAITTPLDVSKSRRRDNGCVGQSIRRQGKS